MYFLEDKAENLINRASGIANPRHLERVVSGTKFRLNMIMDVTKMTMLKNYAKRYIWDFYCLIMTIWVEAVLVATVL